MEHNFVLVLHPAPCFRGSWRGRWSAIQILLQSLMVAQVLTLLAIPRIWIDLDLANPMTYVFVGGLAHSLIVTVVIYLGVERQTG